MTNSLNSEIIKHWQQLRGMTYDLISLLHEEDLPKKLPFPASQDVFFQFNCMVGAQESNLSLIKEGVWRGFSSRLDSERKVNLVMVVKYMNQVDAKLESLLSTLDLLKPFNDGSTPLQHYLVLAEHEAHHQGQLINFIFACDLPIPKSWHDKWALEK